MSAAPRFCATRGVELAAQRWIETERYTPSLPLAMALARYFGTSVEEMFDDGGDI